MEAEKEKFIRENVVKRKKPFRERLAHFFGLVLGAVLFGVIASAVFVVTMPFWEETAFPYLEERFPDLFHQQEVTIPADHDPVATRAAETESVTEEAAETRKADEAQPSGGESAGSTEMTSGTESAGATDEAQMSAEETEATLPDNVVVAFDPEPDPEDLAEPVQEEPAGTGQDSAGGESVAEAAADRIAYSNETTNQAAQFNHAVVSLQADSINADGSVYPAASGILWNATKSEYYILMDYSKVRGATAFDVTFYNGGKIRAILEGADDVTGIAVVTCDRREAELAGITDEDIIPLGNSYNVRIGNTVYCLGSPSGPIWSVALGMISYVSRSNPGIDTDLRYLYSDIEVVDGGGFLVNAGGELIGVVTSNTQSLTDGGKSAAIAISDLKKIIETLSNGSRAAYLGIQGTNVTEEIAADKQIPVGIYVSNALIGAPAYNSGIQNGDVITRFDGVDVSTMRELQSLLAQHSPGDQVVVIIYRQGRTDYVRQSYRITLGSR